MNLRLSRRDLLTMTAGGLFAATGCRRPPAASSRSVHVATAAGGLNATLSELMRQQRFFESLDLAPDVIPMADGAKILGGIFSGSVDLCPMSGFAQIFPAIERGADLKVINAATLLPAQALFSAKPDVRSMKDLEGKVVGVGAIGSLVHQLTATLLKKQGVDVSAVRFVNIGSNTDIFKAVMAGTVDAGTGPASFVDDADAYHVHAIPGGNFSAELQEFTYQAGWTSTRLIETKRALIVGVLAAYSQVFHFVGRPSSEDAFLQARRAAFPNAPEREHAGEWNYLQKYKPFASDLLISEERVRYMQQVNIDFQVQTAMLPFDRIVDLSLAREAQALRARVFA